MPEFLTEGNWRSDFYNCDAWIIGIQRQTQVALFQRLLTLAATAGSIKRNRPVFVSRGEAEMIKYVRSNFFALKQAFFTEVHALCKANDLDYTTVRDGVAMDSRISVSHTAVPESNGRLPKDTSLFHIPIANAGQNLKTALIHDLSNVEYTYTT
jgi:UDP-glucose 6-dehydrogenase